MSEKLTSFLQLQREQLFSSLNENIFNNFTKVDLTVVLALMSGLQMLL